MTHDPEAYLLLSHVRSCELRTAADAHALARRAAASPRPWRRWSWLRDRAGWLLIQMGLRLVHPPTVVRTARW
ncbi:hypothetical protein [Streptomyces daliensis]